MHTLNRNRSLFTLLSCLTLFIGLSFTQVKRHEEDEKAKNLKILPKDISGEDLHMVMRGYSRSLGVRCNHCHVTNGPLPKDYDFASDAKPMKETAREMMKMVDGINKEYLHKIGGGKFEQITCVTCHMGRAKPIISVDSLPKKFLPARRPLLPGSDSSNRKPQPQEK